MKKAKKLTAVVLALAVALTMGMATTVLSFAASDGSISVTTNFEGQTYKLYQLFDATTVAGRTGEDGISYKLMSGKTDFKAVTSGGTTIDGSQWFKLDSKGNVLLADGVTSITFDDTFKAWAEAYGNQIGSALTASQDNDPNIKWENLAEGYYFITTTTGSLVTVDSIKPDVTVEDKNTVPTVDKKITDASNVSSDGKDAMAQLGTDVEYTAEITVGKGSKNLVFHDTMETGLTFKGNSNVTVTASPAQTGTWYTIKETPDSGDTLTITFKDGIPENTKITIKYLATVNAEAVDPLTNGAKVTYGDNNTSTATSTTDVYNAEIAVLKYDGDKSAGKYLDGAGFKLKNSEGKYYKLTGTVVSWETAEADGDEHVSGTDGKVAPFVGLPAGTYTLVESTTPGGYNTAADVNITVAEDTYTAANLSQVAEIENHSGAELPSTGGIGTTIFYILGALLVIVCGIVLVARRRMAEK